MLTDATHVVNYGTGLVGDSEPVDLATHGRARALTHVVEALRAERGGLEAALQQATHHAVGEELHAAVGVVNDKPLLGTKKLVRDDQRANGIVAGTATGIADDVRVALAQARVLGRVKTGIHAGEDGEAAGRWQRQIALVEAGGVGAICGNNLIVYGHSALLGCKYVIHRWFSGD